jgi:hypothetical protein
MFIVHCLRRAAYIERTIGRESSFEKMVWCLSPLAAQIRQEPGKTPEGWIARAAESCAYFFPRIWRRRCLFRSLLMLDWAHRLGVSPTLNVGMRLGPNRDQGHCWLSIGHTPFCEPAGWPEHYAVLFHRSGILQYWVSLASESHGRRTPAPITRRMDGSG